MKSELSNLPIETPFRWPIRNTEDRKHNRICDYVYDDFGQRLEFKGKNGLITISLDEFNHQIKKAQCQASSELGNKI